MAELKVLRVQPGPLDTYSSSRSSKAAASAKLENMLMMGGKVVQRGPIDKNSGVKLTVPSPVTYPTLCVGANTDRVLVPKTSNLNKDLAVVTPGSGITNLTAGVEFIPRPGTAAIDNNLYVASGVLPTSGAIPRIWRWDGTATLPVPLSLSPVFEPRSLASHLERVFVIGDSGHTLFWSDIGGDPSNLAAAWQDNVTGLTNRITVDQVLKNPAFRLVRVGRNLAIIREQSIDLLTGDTPSTFAIRRVCGYNQGIAGMAVCEWDDGAFLLGPRGLHFFNGVEVSLIDYPVRNNLRSVAGEGDGTNNIYSLVRSGEYLVVCCGPGFWGSLHIPTQSWSYITAASPDWASTSPRVITGSADQPDEYHAFDGANLWIASGPDRLLDRTAQMASLGFDAGSGTSAAIPAKWWSKVHDLSAPVTKVALHRVMVEYDFRTATAVPAGQGLYVSLYDSLGNQLLAPTELEEGTTRQRVSIDCFEETSDVQVRIEYANTTATNVTKLEIHDCFVEYQPTSQR